MPNNIQPVERVDPAEFKARLRQQRADDHLTRAASALMQVTGGTDETAAKATVTAIAEYVIHDYAAKLGKLDG